MATDNGQGQEAAKIHYFMPSQFLLLVEHEGRLEAGLVREYIGSFETGGLQRYLNEAKIEQERILTFERQEGRFGQFSLVPVELPGDISDNELIVLNEQLYAQSRRRRNDSLVVRSATPNWLCSPAPPGQMVTGGPGATPVPTTLPSKFWRAPLSDPDTPFGFRLASSAEVGSIPGVTLDASSARQLDEGLAGRGEVQQPVEIALLDTAPTPEAIQKAYDKWSGDHPLLASLLAPNGTLPAQSLRVTYAGDMPNGAALFEALENELDEALSYGLIDHLYNMADHGLFAAGIAHTIAPQATLHLVQVLNRWGVGTIETLALGLQTLLNQHLAAGTKLVVNCSLTVQFPWDRGHAREGLPPSLLKIISTKTSHRASYIERSMLPVRWILEALQGQYPDVLVVAAAGNDGKAGSRRPLARYPAALPDVIGAGALQHNFSFAPYSNQSDVPLNAGIATFGGNMAANGQADAQRGVLGVYTGDFPNPDGSTTANANGWGRWAGTSFAAPVISGILAARMSMGDLPDDAHAWMENLLIEAGGNDNLFPVKQGV